MREIKFRAWDKEANKMITPKDGDFIAWHAPSNWKKWLHVMQFTGLYDKNGKEIYEGDIFDYYGIINVVIYKDGMFCYDSWRKYDDENIVKLSNEHFNWENDKSSEIEVIGNLYESPELLNN